VGFLRLVKFKAFLRVFADMNVAVESILWLFIGSLLSVGLVIVYDVIFFRRFDLQEAIIEGNVSASIFFGLMTLGVGLVVFAVLLSPSSNTLVDDLIQTFMWSIGVTFVATVIFYVCDKIFLPKISLEEEIKNGNVSAGIFSGLIYVLVSIIAMSVILT
jgi:uncharacterized membrane protein YjfL (UPF0719 family)